MASKQYDKENTVRFSLKLNINTDADIISRLDSVDNKQGYIKQLITEDITRMCGTAFDYMDTDANYIIDKG